MRATDIGYLLISGCTLVALAGCDRAGYATQVLQEEQGLEAIQLTEQPDGTFTFTARKGPDGCAGTIAVDVGLFDKSNNVSLRCGPPDVSTKEGRAILEQACAQGSAAACNDFGIAFADGKGVAQDQARAVPLFQRACDGGDAAGCGNLCRDVYMGSGVPKDLPRAIGACAKGCDGGSWVGCQVMGFLYSNGEGVAKDPAKALALFGKGCELGDGTSCANQGIYYRDGIGVPADPARAAGLLQKACGLGFQQACATGN